MQRRIQTARVESRVEAGGFSRPATHSPTRTRLSRCARTNTDRVTRLLLLLQRAGCDRSQCKYCSVQTSAHEHIYSFSRIECARANGQSLLRGAMREPRTPRSFERARALEHRMSESSARATPGSEIETKQQREERRDRVN